MPARVIRDYVAQYPDPISFRTGEKILLGPRDTDNPGWIWATSSATGRTGWVPENLLQITGETATTLRHYSAAEVSVKEGDIVTVLEVLLGWALVETASQERGWVPQNRLAQSVSAVDLPL